MATNPNDIAKLLNEMAKTLQELSDAQLDSVKSIVEEKVKQKESLKIIKRKETELNKKIESDSRRLIEDKKKKNKLILLSTNATKNLIDKTTKAISNKKKELLKIDNIASTFGFSKELDWYKSAKKLLLPAKVKPAKITLDSIKKNSQSSENFSVKDDLQLLQLEMLKSIDSKIGNLSSETSGGGLFDFLFKAIPKLFSGLLQGGGALAGGAFGVGKYGKLFKIPNIVKGGASLLTKIKNPKVAIPLVLGSIAAAGGVGLYNMMKKPEQGLEGRAKGGGVKDSNAYIVGEDGPEVFVPKQSGNIIPNNKIKNTKTFSSEVKMRQVIKELSKDLIKKMGKVWAGAFTPFKKSFKAVVGKLNTGMLDWKDYITDFLSSSLDKLKTFLLESIPSFIKGGLSKVKSLGRSVMNFVGLGKEDKKPNVSPPSVVPSSPTPIPKKAIPKWAAPTLGSTYGKTNTSLEPKASGDYNIKETKMYKIHQNEMIIPKQQSEMLRAISELKSGYNIPTPVENTQENSLDKTFWMNRFVPAFQKAIKSNKIDKSVLTNRIASAF